MYMNTDYHSLFLSAANEREKETKNYYIPMLNSHGCCAVLDSVIFLGGSKPMSAGLTACTRPKKNRRRESLVMATCMYTI